MCRSLLPRQIAPKRFECGEHLRVREVGVAAARVRKHENGGISNDFALKSGLDNAAVFRKERPEDGDADQRHDRWTAAKNLPPKPGAACDVLLTPDRVDAWRGPGHDVRDAVSPFRQASVVPISDRLRHQPRFVQQLPEAVREAREVMSGQRRSNPGIDADEQDADAVADPVAKRRQDGRYDSCHGR